MLNKCFRGIFKDVVAGIVEFQSVCFGEASLEAGEEFMGSEAPVLHTPDKLDWVIFELSKPLLDLTERGIAGVRLVEWDIVHELSNGDATGPRVIRCEVAGFGGRRERFGDGHYSCGAGKQVEPLNAQLSEEGNAAYCYAKRYGGAAKSTGVHEDKAVEAVGMESGTAHSDGATPVVCEERDILQIEELDKLSKPVDVALEGVETWLLRFFREAAAEVIDGDDAMVVAECGHEFSPREAPRWVTVNHQERWS